MICVQSDLRPLLFCLPGALLDERQFNLQREELSDEIQIKVIDYRDTLTAHPDDRGIERAATAVGARIAARSERDVFLCGHSLGGMIAQTVAANYSDHIKGLILIETSYGPFPPAMRRIAGVFSKAALHLASWSVMRSSVIKYHGQYSTEARTYLSEALPSEEPAHWRSVVEQALVFDGREALSAISVPTLLVVGALNRMTQGQARRMARSIPDASIAEIPEAGHMVNLDRSKAVSAKMRNVCFRNAQQ